MAMYSHKLPQTEVTVMGFFELNMPEMAEFNSLVNAKTFKITLIGVI